MSTKPLSVNHLNTIIASASVNLPLLQVALETIEEGFTISDMRQPDMPLIYVNPGFEALTGYTAQEALGHNCRFLQGSERDQQALAILRNALQQSEPCCVILRNYRKDGTPFWNELSLYPLLDQQGKLTHYVGVQHDISEIVERSRRLIGAERESALAAEQHAHSLLLLNEMSRAFNTATTETDIYQIVADYTPQIVQAERVSIALLVGDGQHVEIMALQGKIGAVVPGKRLPIQGTTIEQAVQTQQVTVRLNHYLATTGGMSSRMSAPLITGATTIGTLNVSATQPYAFTQRDEQLLAQIAGLLASAMQSRRLFAQTQAALDENRRLYTSTREYNATLLQTLTQLHTTQTQLIAAEKMASLGRLVAGLAHEISTPIGIAVTAASVWEDRIHELRQLYQSGGMKRTDFEEFLETIFESGRLISHNLQRAADLIQSFKQVAVDQSSEVVRDINLKSYIGEVVTSLRPELKRTNLTVEIMGENDVVLQSYPGALSQIITNLILNSITHAYAPNEAGRLTITIECQDDKVYLHYSDDGKGIPVEDHARIFEPFFTTRRGQGGSGLGLHIVYNLVTQKLGGTIRFQSQEGVGTIFTIVLPIYTHEPRRK